MGEALLPVELREPLYEVAAALPGAELLVSARDELGRTGPGVARTERGLRAELIFEPDSGELLARREVMVDPTADLSRRAPWSGGPVICHAGTSTGFPRAFRRSLGHRAHRPGPVAGL
jgi:hypothetical protein